MSNFDIYKWNRERHLVEARLNEEKSKHDLYLDMFIQELEGFDGGAADYLKNHRNLMLRNMSSIDMDLSMADMNEEISDYEMVVYKVKGVTAEPYEGGPDEPFEMEVKLESSLSADEVKDAIRDAARKEQGKLYKLDYKKA
jgi:hypothetical protein